MSTGQRKSVPIIGAQSIAVCFLVVCATAAAAPQTQPVPRVRCPANGQMGPMKSPSAGTREVTLRPAVAAQLAYYDAFTRWQNGSCLGPHAPRGAVPPQWHTLLNGAVCSPG